MTTDLFNVAQALHRRGHYAQAHQAIIECIESAVNVRHGERLADGLLLFADNLLHYCPEGGDPFTARKAAASEALELFRQLGDTRGEARALLVLSSVDVLNCSSLAAGSLAAASACGDKKVAAGAIRQIANCRSILGDGAEALRLATEAVDIARQEGDGNLLSQCLYTLGIIESDHIGRSKAFGEMVSLRLGGHEELDFACRVAGAASLVIYNDVDLAEKWWNVCLEIARSHGDVSLEGVACRGLAEVASIRGQTAKAEELGALADVLCPTPGASEFERAAEAGNVENAFEVVKSLVAPRKT